MGFICNNGLCFLKCFKYYFHNCYLLISKVSRQGIGSLCNHPILSDGFLMVRHDEDNLGFLSALFSTMP